MILNVTSLVSLILCGFVGEQVRHVAVPDSRVVPVLVHPLTTTTVLFPHPIVGFEGMGFSESSEQGGDYYLNVMPDRGWVSLGVWNTPSPPRNLQIYSENTLITLLVIPVPEPGQSLFQLHLYEVDQEALKDSKEGLENVHEVREASSLKQSGVSEIIYRKNDLWEWQDLRFLIQEIEVVAQKETRLGLYITNLSKNPIAISPSQVRVLVEGKLWKAESIEECILSPGESKPCNVWFPFGAEEVSSDSIYRLMLGYEEREG